MSRAMTQHNSWSPSSNYHIVLNHQEPASSGAHAPRAIYIFDYSTWTTLVVNEASIEDAGVYTWAVREYLNYLEGMTP